MRNNQSRLILTILLSAIALLASACSQPAPTAAPTAAQSVSAPTAVPTATAPPIKYRVRALFPIPVEAFESAPQVIGKRMGYFAEEGIDLIYEGSGTVTGEGTKLLSEGQADFALLVTPAALAARAGKVPVKSVCTEREEFIFDYAVSPDSGITFIAQLEGKKIGVGDASWVVFSSPLLIAGGVDPSKVEPVVVGVPNRAAALESKQVDAVLTWLIEEETWQGRGVKFNLLKGADLLDLPSNSWLASEKTITEQPEMVKAFLRAEAKAHLFLQTNPAAAAEMVLEEYPALGADWPTALASVTRYAQKQPKQLANGFCYHDRAAWSSAVNTYQQMGIFPAIPVDDIFTNQFVEAANKFDHEVVIKQAQNYTLKPEHKQP